MAYRAELSGIKKNTWPKHVGKIVWLKKTANFTSNILGGIAVFTPSFSGSTPILMTLSSLAKIQQT